MTEQKRQHNQTSVIICDDQVVIREGLSRILAEKNISVMGQCATLPEVSKLTGEFKDAVIVTDLLISNTLLGDMLSSLRTYNSSCKVVIYSMRETLETIRLCYGAGVMAFVMKRDTIEELLKAIAFANLGKRYVPPLVGEVLANIPVRQEATGDLLNDRELSAFHGYVRGETLNTIAHELQISESSVNNILTQIGKKLGIKRKQFVEYARSKKMIE